MGKRLFIFGQLLLLVFWASAQGLIRPLDLVGGGAVTCVVTRPGYLYAGCGHEIRVLDTDAPGKPPVFAKRLDGPVVSLSLAGAHLYVCASAAGLYRFDLSNPGEPVLDGHYRPKDNKQAATSVHVRGDSIWVGMGNEITLLKSGMGIGSNLERVEAFGEHLQSQGGIVATAISGRYFAAIHAGREKGLGNGAHIYDLHSFQRVGFFQQPAGQPMAACFSNSGRFLWVTAEDIQHERGLVYALDLKNPTRPQVAFADTLTGYPGGFSSISMIVADDTVLVAARRAHNVMRCPEESSYVWAYAGGERLHRVGTLAYEGEISGICRDGMRLWAAMGSGGVAMQEWPRKWGMDCKDAAMIWTDPGGICHASDAFGELLVLAEGRDGVALYQKREGKYALRQRLDGIGNVQNVKFNGTGTHIIAFIQDGVGDSIRVLGSDSLQFVSSYRGRLGHEHIHMWQDRFFVMLPGQVGFEVIDFRNPLAPKRERGVLVNLNAFGIDNLGHLILASPHAIRVVDIHDGRYKELGRISRWGEGYGTSAGWDGIYYVATEARGVVKLKLISKGEDFVLVETGFEKLPTENVEHMAVDEQGLFLAGNSFGLLRLDLRSLKVKEVYGGALTGKVQKGLGLREMFCWGDQIFMVDLTGGVRVLTALKPK